MVHRVKPGRDAFAVVWGLDGWQSSERISERMWLLRRALDVKDVAHTEQQNLLFVLDVGGGGRGGSGEGVG